MRRRPPNEPVYGSMPTAVEGDGEASQRLRAEAQRRRRRNARVGWVMAVALFGSAVVAGWFVYRAFDDEEPTAGSASAEPAAEAAGQRDVVSETDGGGAPTSSPDAASQPAGDPTPGDGIVPPGQAATSVRIADRPDFRTLLYDVRVHSGVDVDAPYRHFSATYDTVADDYHGLLADSASGETSLVSFSGEWRYEVGPDGIHRRARRSKFSLQPEPDTMLANLLAETDVLPESARPFATLTSSGPFPGEVVDGTSGTIFVYELDADAFRAADPGAHAAWTSLWATAMPDSLDLVVPGSEQVQLREVTPLDTLQDREQIDLTGLEVQPVGDRTAVVYRVTERGIVDGAVVVSPEHDTRVVYVAAAYADDPASLTFDEDGVWVDAPE
ncbi:hypothetical protein [Ilumatobacter sp.]|uniref:hypothetical protein n=1 Tax=Ilumatobacter sp. TaxID=1967498 RepID=UPI003AF6A01F